MFGLEIFRIELVVGVNVGTVHNPAVGGSPNLFGMLLRELRIRIDYQSEEKHALRSHAHRVAHNCGGSLGVESLWRPHARRSWGVSEPHGDRLQTNPVFLHFLSAIEVFVLARNLSLKYDRRRFYAVDGQDGASILFDDLCCMLSVGGKRLLERGGVQHIGRMIRRLRLLEKIFPFLFRGIEVFDAPILPNAVASRSGNENYGRHVRAALLVCKIATKLSVRRILRRIVQEIHLRTTRTAPIKSIEIEVALLLAVHPEKTNGIVLVVALSGRTCARLKLRTFLHCEWRLRRDRDESDIVRLHHPERFAAVRQIDNRNLTLGSVALFDFERVDALREVGLPEKVAYRHIGSFGIYITPTFRACKGGKLKKRGDKCDIFHGSRISGLRTPFLQA